jgi:hypothetical protein
MSFRSQRRGSSTKSMKQPFKEQNASYSTLPPGLPSSSKGASPTMLMAISCSLGSVGIVIERSLMQVKTLPVVSFQLALKGADRERFSKVGRLTNSRKRSASVSGLLSSFSSCRWLPESMLVTGEITALDEGASICVIPRDRHFRDGNDSEAQRVWNLASRVEKLSSDVWVNGG